MTKSVKDEIIEQVDCLDDPQRRELLEFARTLRLPPGTPGRDLLRFVGSIDPGNLRAIANAIQEGCEGVEPNVW